MSHTILKGTDVILSDTSYLKELCDVILSDTSYLKELCHVILSDTPYLKELCSHYFKWHTIFKGTVDVILSNSKMSDLQWYHWKLYNQERIWYQWFKL